MVAIARNNPELRREAIAALHKIAPGMAEALEEDEREEAEKRLEKLLDNNSDT